MVQDYLNSNSVQSAALNLIEEEEKDSPHSSVENHRRSDSWNNAIRSRNANIQNLSNNLEHARIPLVN